MEQRISYASGFDIETPDPARVGPAYSGGFFGLESNVPAFLRGPADGFIVECVIRARDEETNVGEPPETEFVCGSFDFTNEFGWAFVLTEGTALNYFLGDGIDQIDLFPGVDNVARMEFDGTDVEYFLNGHTIGASPAIAYTTGPDNFGIGGTSDASFVTELGTAAWGLVTGQFGGLRVSDYYTPAEIFTAGTSVIGMPQTRAYLDDREANDIIQPSNRTLNPEAANLFSVRRGIPQLVDNGGETWDDDALNSDVVLTRIGAQTNASVEARRPAWGANPE